MKLITQDFSWKAWFSPLPWVDLGSVAEAKIKPFQNIVMLHIELKGITNGASYNHLLCTYTRPRHLRSDQRSHI